MPDRKPPNPVTAYIPAVTLGKPSVYLHPDGYAVVSWTDPQTFKRLLSMHVETAQQGRELAQVFASASMMLDPQAPLYLAHDAIADAEQCDVDWGSATASQRCVRPADHDGVHIDRDATAFGDETRAHVMSSSPGHDRPHAPLDDDDLDDGMDDRFDGPDDDDPCPVCGRLHFPWCQQRAERPPSFGDLPWFSEELCTLCGSGEFLVRRDSQWQCWNTDNCAGRQAAKAGA